MPGLNGKDVEMKVEDFSGMTPQSHTAELSPCVAQVGIGIVQGILNY